MFLASRSFLDPLSAVMRRGLGLPPLEAVAAQPTARGLRALAAGAVVMVLWLANAIQTYAELHTMPVVAMIAVSILLVGGITYGWILGARSGWPLAALLGGLAGFIVNGGATYLIIAAQNASASPADVLAASLASAASTGAKPPARARVAARPCQQPRCRQGAAALMWIAAIGGLAGSLLLAFAKAPGHWPSAPADSNALPL